MAVNNLLRLSLHWSGYGEEGTVGMHFAGAPTASAEQLSDALSAINDSLTNDDNPAAWTLLQGLLTTVQAYDRLDLYQYAVDNAPSTSQGQLTVNKAGTVSTNCTGLQQALVVTTNTGAPGRSQRGRMYLPGHTATLAVADAQLSQAGCTNVLAVARTYAEIAQSGLNSSLGTNDIDFVVYSRARRAARKVTSLTVDSRVDSQRRRAAHQVPLRRATGPGPQ